MIQSADPSAGLGDEDRIVLTGLVDAAVGERLGVLVAERLADGTQQLGIDLSGVEAIDEPGLVAIVRIWHEMSSSGRQLSLLDPSPVIGSLLSMTGLTASSSESAPSDSAGTDSAGTDV